MGIGLNGWLGSFACALRKLPHPRLQGIQYLWGMANVGRPLVYESPEKLQVAVDMYLTDNPRPTLAGLALALGINRQTLYNYAERDEFIDIIKKARETVEAKYEERLVWDNSPTGTIFALKNMGWKDKTEQDMNITGSPINIVMPPGE